jgi:hypothetical protein
MRSRNVQKFKKVQIFKEGSMRSRVQKVQGRFKSSIGSKKFNLDTIFQMKNHSIDGSVQVFKPRK